MKKCKNCGHTKFLVRKMKLLHPHKGEIMVLINCKKCGYSVATKDDWR